MPQLIVTDSTYQFVPPHAGNIWPRLLSHVARWVVRKRYGIEHIEVRGAERLTPLLRDNQALLLTPNHSRICDALVLQSLSATLRQPFFVMASAHLFRGSRLMKWALRRIGAFSVYREGVDRKALDTATEILTEARRPLVIFPEGALSHANERLNALMEGVSFIARNAARKLKKLEANGNRQVYVVPVAIRYLYQGDLRSAVDPKLEEIERRLTWRPHLELSVVERIYKLGHALLGLKEIEYLGVPQSGTIAERLNRLIDALLLPLEHEWLSGRTDHSVVNRVKELRKAIVPEMIDKLDDGNEKLPVEELNRRWRQLEDMQLAQSLSLFPKEYVASRPSVDRILETVQRMAAALSGEEQSQGPVKVVIQVGQPLEVAGKRERGAETDSVLAHIESELTSMIQELSELSPLYVDPSN